MRKEETVTVDLLHRAVPAKHTDEGLRALSGESPIHPESVQKYLESKSGDALEDVSGAMRNWLNLYRPPNWPEKPTPCTRNLGPRFPLAKRDGGPPASWTWTASAGWLRHDPEKRLFNYPDLYLIRKTGSNKALTRFSNSPTLTQIEHCEI